MAQDAELKLKVSLDLGFFRQQLAGLGQAAAGYNIPVNIQFNKKSIADQYRLLNKYIGNKTFRVEINTNLDAEIKKAKDLASELAKITAGGGGTISRKTGTFRQELLNIVDTEQIRRIYAAAAKSGILTFSEEANKGKKELVKALNDAANDAGQGFLNAFSAQNSAVRKAAGDYGDALLGGLRKTLRSQSPSQEMFDIGEDAGKGFELGLLRSMELAEQSATRKMRRMLDRLARVALMVGGMSAAEINRQAGQFQGGASVAAPSWASTVPPSRGGGGGGRLLSPGPTFAALGGTAFGAQKYLPTDLSAELKQILRGAAFAFVDAIRTETRSVRVGIGASMQAALPASRVAGLLPAGVGRTPNRYATGAIGGETREQMFARRTQEAYTRSGLRGIDIMGGGAGREPSPYSYAYKPISRAIVPYQAPGALVATGGGGGAQPPQGPTGGGFGGFGQFGRAMGGVSLPGAGTIRELGTEFSFAAKQVLLFGTAYKALAFIQAFPGQVGQAVGQLQSFRNTLNTISPSAQEAAASNKLILDLVDKYNVPLQSARDGFTKLYASMAPAGFSGKEIRDLFTGISKAAATFGMSADKVDRVNYAFAQMASKGQVMSEELKGQLGDVLPGAMAIFAEAAGFKGPKAIQDFSAALEEGAYKGEAMRVLLKNVGIVMNKEFGPGAEGAAKTFQGLINRMANSTQMLYESFEPVAVGFLNSIVVPLTSGIKQISDGFNAFFTGTKAQTAGGSAFAKALEDLRPAFDGIRNNLSSLIPQLIQFGQIALNVSKFLLQIAGNPIVGYLAKLYLVALPLNMLFNGLSGIIGRVVMAMTTLNVGLLAGTQRFTTYRIAMQAFGVSAAQVSTTLRAWAPALNLATIALRAIAAPAVLFGISLLIERFMMLQGAINGVAQSTQGMLGNISSLANSGAVKELSNVGKDIQNQISSFESLRPFLGGGAAGLPQQKLTKQGAAKMRELGLGSFVGTDVLGGSYVKDFTNASRIVEERLRGLRKTAESVREKLPLARRVQEDISGQVIAKPGAMPEGTTTEKGTKRESKVPELTVEVKYQEALLNLESQIANAKLGGNELLAIRLEGEKELLDLKFEAQKVEVDNIPQQDKQLKIEAIRSKAEIARMKTRFNMEQEINKAIQEQQDAVDKLVKSSKIELSNSRKYAELLLNGVSPANAQIFIETENQIDQIRERLTLTREQIKLEIDRLKALKAQGKVIDEKELANLETKYGTTGEAINALPGIQANIVGARMQAAAPKSQALLLAEEYGKIQEELEKMVSLSGLVIESAKGIGEAFGNSFKNMINGSMTAQEALASFFQNIGDYFVDMAARMIAKWMEMQAIGLAQNLLSGLAGAAGGGMGIGGAVSAAGKLNPSVGFGAGTFTGFASGGIAKGGFVPFRAFAEGGMVAGPTLGLVGEGKYNEAIIPMPNGKSVPVDLQGAAPGNQIVSNITVNVSNGQAQTEGGSGAADLSRKLEGAVKQVIIGELRPGGVLAGRR